MTSNVGSEAIAELGVQTWGSGVLPDSRNVEGFFEATWISLGMLQASALDGEDADEKMERVD